MLDYLVEFGCHVGGRCSEVSWSGKRRSEKMERKRDIGGSKKFLCVSRKCIRPPIRVRVAIIRPA